MSPVRLRLTTATAFKESRLAEALAKPGAPGAELAAAVRDAQLSGSLGLAGIAIPPEEVAAVRRGADAPEPITRLLQAARAVDESAPLSVAAVEAWHRALTGQRGFRTGERARTGGGPPGAPPAFVESRLLILEQWVSEDSSRELAPAAVGALVLARVMEILPFDEGNGLVARLGASHVMVRAGARPPILLAEDRPRLDAALEAAFQLHTEPLAALLAEAADRALDVMLAHLGP